MLFLQFHIGPDRYALDINAVVEVLPLLHIQPLPRSSPGVAGVLNYRGTPVPAIDLRQITQDRPADRRRNTRIVLVRRPDEGRAVRLVGLIAEKVTTAVTSSLQRVTPGAGSVTADGRGLLHWLDIGSLPATADLVFDVPAEGQWG